MAQSIRSKKSWVEEIEEEELLSVKVKEIEEESIIVGAFTPSLPSHASLPNFGKNLKSTPEKAKPPTVELPQEDISLTGHLDVKLGLVSPCKKKETPRLLKDRQNTKADLKSPMKRKLVDPVDKPDELLMPSPSKMRRATPKKESSPAVRDIPTRKRLRESITPRKSLTDSEKKRRDLETDAETLSRRQRQIDYGKNTIGYERYTQLVPREARKKMHPKTPPLQFKFSRRAWDGLIKVWRQRLHFWDPPSEGGGNAACLEIPSDMSDCSSTDGSLPNTPVQEWKRQRRLRSASRNTTEEPEDDVSQGCTPLPD